APRGLGERRRGIAFAISTGQGADPGLYEEAAERTAEVFTRPSLAEKLRYRAQRHGSVNQGYFPIKETSDIHPDLVEGWVFCRRAFDLGPEGLREDAFWPLPGFEPLFRRLVQAQERLVLPGIARLLTHL